MTWGASSDERAVSGDQVGYRHLIGLPGARRILGFGLMGRFPASMFPVGLVVAGEAASGSYGVGGAASAGFSLAGAVAAPVAGRFVDRYGQKLMGRLLGSVFALSTSGLVWVLVSRAAVWLILPLSVLAGLSFPNLGAFARTRWARMVRPSELERSQALESINDEISFLVGPPAATLLATLVTPWVPVLAAAASAVVGILGMTAVPFEAVRRSEPFRALRRWLDGPRLALLGSLIGIGVVLGGVTVTVIAFTDSIGAPGWAAVAYAVNSAASLVAALLFGRISGGRMHVRYLLAATSYLLTLLPYGFVGFTGPSFTLVAAVAGIGIAPMFIQANSIVAATTPLEQRTEAFSWVGAAVGVGLALGSAIAGLVVDEWGAEVGRMWVSASAVIPLVLAGVWMRLRRVQQ